MNIYKIYIFTTEFESDIDKFKFESLSNILTHIPDKNLNQFSLLNEFTLSLLKYNKIENLHKLLNLKVKDIEKFSLPWSIHNIYTNGDIFHHIENIRYFLYKSFLLHKQFTLCNDFFSYQEPELNEKISDLNLHTTAINSLLRSKIYCFGDLLQYGKENLSKIKGLGKKYQLQVINILN